MWGIGLQFSHVVGYSNESTASLNSTHTPAPLSHFQPSQPTKRSSSARRPLPERRKGGVDVAEGGEAVPRVERGRSKEEKSEVCPGGEAEEELARSHGGGEHASCNGTESVDSGG